MAMNPQGIGGPNYQNPFTTGQGWSPTSGVPRPAWLPGGANPTQPFAGVGNPAGFGRQNYTPPTGGQGPGNATGPAQYAAWLAAGSPAQGANGQNYNTAGQLIGTPQTFANQYAGDPNYGGTTGAVAAPGTNDPMSINAYNAAAPGTPGGYAPGTPMGANPNASGGVNQMGTPITA